MAEINVIKFIEDSVNKGGLALWDAHKMSRHWYDSNKEYIQIISGIYNVLEDQSEEFKDTEEYRKDIVVQYTGEAKYCNPQECKHENTRKDIIIQGDCQTKGIAKIICNDCNLTLGTEETEITNHDYTWTNNNDATCTENGTETGVCKNNDSTVTREIENSALGHDYPDEWTIKVSPSCGSTGLRYKVCKRCANQIEEIIPALEHNWVSNNNGTHTCKTEGGCGKTENCTAPAPGDHCPKCGYIVYPLAIKTESLPTDVYDNIVYPTTTLLSNVTENVVWSVTEGILPTGLTLSEDGVLSGSPTATGSYTFTVTANYNEQSDSKEYTIVVHNAVCQVTFNNNWDTSVENESRTVSYGTAIGELPVLTRDDYEFLGWYTTSAAGNKIEEDYEVYADITLYAHWTKESCTITFEPEGGECDETTRVLSKGDKIGDLPDAEREGYLFGGWYTAATGGLKVDENFSVNSSISLYARWAQQGVEDTDIVFGDATTQFNISINGDRTNYANQPYTLYGRVHDDSDASCDLTFQTGFSSDDMTNAITETNKKVILYLKVTNNSDETNEFDIGFDCDSYIVGDNNDNISITRLENGVLLGDTTNLSVTVPYDNTSWMGRYSERTKHRYDNMEVGYKTDAATDTGYTLTMNNIHINANSYTILEITFQIP